MDGKEKEIPAITMHGILVLLPGREIGMAAVCRQLSPVAKSHLVSGHETPMCTARLPLFELASSGSDFVDLFNRGWWPPPKREYFGRSVDAHANLRIPRLDGPCWTTAYKIT